MRRLLRDVYIRENCDAVLRKIVPCCISCGQFSRTSTSVFKQLSSNPKFAWVAVFTFGRRRAVQRDELCHHQRTQEFGVRIAPGASRIEVLQLVTRDGVLLTLPGLFLGIAVAIVTLHFSASI